MKVAEQSQITASRVLSDSARHGSPDLSVVIVNWKGLEYLEECFDSIFEHTKGIDIEVIFVDNASSDGSVDFVKSNYPAVKIIVNKRNLGFARANNQAFPYCSGKYILLLNPDTRVLGDALSDMVYFMNEHPETGIAGCKILNPDLTLQPACRRSMPNPEVAFYRLAGLSKLFPGSRRFSRYNFGYVDQDEEIDVDAVSGSFLLFRREVLEEIGPLDEDFFLYGEELDWCLRAKNCGWKITYNPDAEIIHYKGGSSKRNRLRSQYEFHRAMLLFHKKHYAGRLFFPVNLLISIGVLLRGIATGILPALKMLALIAADAILINISQIAAFYIKLGGLEQPHFGAYVKAAPLMTGATVLVIWGAKLYSGKRDRDSVQITYETIRALSVAAGVFVLANFISRSFASLAFPYPRFVFLLGWGIAALPMSIVKVFLFSANVQKKAANRIAIIGTGEPAMKLQHELGSRLRSGSKFIGFVGDSSTADDSGTILGHVEMIPSVLHRYALTEVIIAVGSWPSHRLMHVIASCENSGVGVKILPNLYEILISRVELTNIAGMPLIKLPTDPLSGWYRALKRAADIVGSMFSLILLSWIFPFVAMGIKLSSPGPVLFRQTRLGKNEKEFILLKFRTMISDAEKESGPVLSEPLDPRVTRIGRFLRRSHLDELPQLINILRGQMSFVGPRPERPEFVRIFVKEDQTYQRRFVVRPGLTGLAQIHGRYDSDPSDKLKFDLAYVNNVSLGLDLRVLLVSIRTILSSIRK